MSKPVFSGSEFELRPKAQPRSDGQQHIQREVFPFTALDFRDARLRDTKFSGGYCLRPAFGRDAFLDTYHNLGAHLENGRFIFIKAKVEKDVAAAFGDPGVVPAGIYFFHPSFSHQLVSPFRKLNIAPTRLAGFLLEGVKHVNNIHKLGDLNHAPGSIEANPDFIGAFTHFFHGLEVNRLQPILYPEKLLAKHLANLCWKLSQSVPAAANEGNGLCFHRNNYINTYLKPTTVSRLKFMEMPERQP